MKYTEAYLRSWIGLIEGGLSLLKGNIWIKSSLLTSVFRLSFLLLIPLLRQPLGTAFLLAD